MVGFMIRPGALRPLLAACLTMLLLVTSFAPCCVFAAPLSGPYVSAPADPCKHHAPVAPAACACTQLACQAFDHPVVAALHAPALSTPVAFLVPVARHTDRDERPDHPPPRALL